jgi:hypothetical protein
MLKSLKSHVLKQKVPLIDTPTVTVYCFALNFFCNLDPLETNGDLAYSSPGFR